MYLCLKTADEMKLSRGDLVLMKYILLGIVSFTITVNGCQVERKAIDEDRTLTCSDSPSTTNYTWLFDNRTQVDSNVLVSEGGQAVVIPSGSNTVYGDYSCYESDSLVNCFSVYIRGICNQTCSRLTVDNTTFIANSNIAFYLTVIVNTSPDDHGTMILRKDGLSVSGSNVNHTSLNLLQVTYYIHNVQPKDSGVYDAEYNGMHATLFTNKISIRVIEINYTSSSSQLPSSTFVTPQGTPTGNNRTDSSQSSDNVGAIVGSIVGVLVLIVIIVIVALVICYCRTRNRDRLTEAKQESHSQLPEQETNNGSYQDGLREDISQDRFDGESV